MQRIVTPQGIPFIFLQDEKEIEQIQDNMCIIPTKKGLFVRKKNDLYTSLSKMEEGGFFPELKEKVLYRCGMINFEMFSEIEKFFKAIYNKYKSEVCVLLFYNFNTEEWCWSIPKQEVSSGGVQYDREKGEKFISATNTILEGQPEDFKLIGSIHSHANMSAFHSGVDDKDEFNFDGLHITIGHLGGSCSYSIRWIFSGKDYKVEKLEEVVEQPEESVKFVSELMDMVEERKVQTHVISGNFNNKWERNYGYNQNVGAGLSENTPHSNVVNNSHNNNGNKKKQEQNSSKKEALAEPKEFGITLYKD